METERKIIEIDDELCTGCGDCVPSCAEGALQIVGGKARLVADLYCDGLGACLGECPTGALKIIERTAEEFDEEAVEELLATKEQEETHDHETMACGCPSTQIQSFVPAEAGREANATAASGRAVSELSQWPVQIRLVPPTAPFLQGANLLVAADCTPVAYPNFHQDFLKEKAILVGCPKLDDAEEYVQKFGEIFSKANIKSITVVVMEVPCCQGLPIIVEKGMEIAGKTIPMEKVVISARGEILQTERLAA